jgi:hypothetical protein
MAEMCGHVRAAIADSFLLQWHTCATYLSILNYATVLLFAASNYSVPYMHAPPCAYANLPSWHGAQVSLHTSKQVSCYPSNTAIDHAALYRTGLLCVLHACQVAYPTMPLCECATMVWCPGTYIYFLIYAMLPLLQCHIAHS